MRVAFGQALKQSQEEVDGSIAESFSRENKGRFRRVEGTQRESAREIRAVSKAAWGRISRIRILEELGSWRKSRRSAGVTGVKGEDGEAMDILAMGVEGGGMRRRGVRMVGLEQ